ncbi:MAG: hypothetical protein IT205_05340 [Fimbriimonadaceae bacterium]|nr:hypothetical protein [Fimbriimonadaceae bacterium]
MAGKIFMGVFKWLLVPVALAFIGYAFIGPHIGRNPPSSLKKLASNTVSQPEPTSATTANTEPEGSGKDWPAPKVEVELRRLNGNRVKDRTIHKPETSNATSEPKVTENNAPEEVPNAEGDGEQPSPEEPPTNDLPEGPGP